MKTGLFGDCNPDGGQIRDFLAPRRVRPVLESSYTQIFSADLPDGAIGSRLAGYGLCRRRN